MLTISLKKKFLLAKVLKIDKLACDRLYGGQI